MLQRIIERLVCSSCKGDLIQQDQNLRCVLCEAVYTIQDEYVQMVDDDRSDHESDVREREIKEGEKRDYTLIGQSLEETGVGRFATFLNFGYVANENKQYSMIKLEKYGLNLNSVKLLLETIGHVNVSDKEIIDIGCGRGGNVTTINKYFSPRSIVGLDICPANISFCNTKNIHSDTGFIVGDAEQIPFADESFDIAINIESAHAYPNRMQFYKEVHRLLKPSGMFLYTELMPVELYKQSLIQLSQLGFELIRDDNVTSNVLLSCDDNAKQRAGTQGITNRIQSDSQIPEIKDFIALPGSKKYNAMKQGKLEYRMMSWMKQVQ